VGQLGRRLAGKPPEPVANALELDLYLRPARRRLERAFVEEEQRLDVRPQRAEQAHPAFLWTGVRPLVRPDHAGRVRLDPDPPDEPAARPRDAVRADIVLLEPPQCRLVIADEDALREPLAPQAGGALLVVRKGQMDDVVLALGEVAGALLGAEHVVRRSDEPLDRAGLLLVVTHRLERPHLGHAEDATSRLR